MESEFLGRHGLRESWHLEEMFDAVKAPLFRAVVLNRIDPAGNAPHFFWQYLPDFMSCRRFPREEDMSAEFTLLRQSGTAWDSEDSIGRLLASEVSLEFLDLFEWDIPNLAFAVAYIMVGRPSKNADLLVS